MTKIRTAALILAGATAGLGGKAAVEGALGKAVAAPSAPSVHALDLRRDYSGAGFKFTVYANRSQSDAGYADLGQAKKCQKLSDVSKKQLIDCMAVAGSACEW